MLGVNTAAFFLRVLALDFGFAFLFLWSVLFSCFQDLLLEFRGLFIVYSPPAVFCSGFEL